MQRHEKFINNKIRKYEMNGDEARLRKYQRHKWALVGVQEHGFEFKIVYFLQKRFERLDLVPTHYNYPEFYQF